MSGDVSVPQNLPALILRAGNRLLEARSSGEVLEAKHLAEAALHYAKVTKAANDTHADCLRIITRAEMRMADEVDRGQANGEVAHNTGRGGIGISVQTSDTKPSTFDDLGIDRRRVAEWRETRDAGEEVVERAIQGALNEGRAPTKADIAKHVRGTFGTGENEWYTPDEYLAAARDVLGGIDLDPASSAAAQKKVCAANFFTAETNGLHQKWSGRVWLNPPYAQPYIADFIAKLSQEAVAGNIEAAIALTHNYTDTQWFHQAVSVADAICFTRGRIKFYDNAGAIAAPTQGQAFFYIGKSPELFVERFSSVGFVVRPLRDARQGAANAA